MKIETTPKLDAVFSLIRSSVSDDMFKKLVSRIVSSYPEKSIGDQEINSLSQNLSLSHEQSQNLVSAIYMLLNKVSYDVVKPSEVKKVLSNHLGEDKANIFASIWSKSASDIVGRLQNMNTENSLENVVWEKRVTISKDCSSKLKDTKALLQLQINGEHQTVAFTYDKLVNFYLELERIQSCIDKLA